MSGVDFGIVDGTNISKSCRDELIFEEGVWAKGVWVKGVGVEGLVFNSAAEFINRLPVLLFKFELVELRFEEAILLRAAALYGDLDTGAPIKGRNCPPLLPDVREVVKPLN